MINYISDCYRKWLLDKVICECWSTVKCANYLGRPHSKVLSDLNKFLEEAKVG